MKRKIEKGKHHPFFFYLYLNIIILLLIKLIKKVMGMMRILYLFNYFSSKNNFNFFSFFIENDNISSVFRSLSIPVTDAPWSPFGCLESGGRRKEGHIFCCFDVYQTDRTRFEFPSLFLSQHPHRAQFLFENSVALSDEITGRITQIVC